MTYPDAVRRAGHADGYALFDAILTGRNGIAEWIPPPELDTGQARTYFYHHPERLTHPTRRRPRGGESG